MKKLCAKRAPSWPPRQPRRLGRRPIEKTMRLEKVDRSQRSRKHDGAIAFSPSEYTNFNLPQRTFWTDNGVGSAQASRRVTDLAWAPTPHFPGVGATLFLEFARAQRVRLSPKSSLEPEECARRRRARHCLLGVSPTPSRSDDPLHLSDVSGRHRPVCQSHAMR